METQTTTVSAVETHLKDLLKDPKKTFRIQHKCCTNPAHLLENQVLAVEEKTDGRFKVITTERIPLTNAVDGLVIKSLGLRACVSYFNPTTTKTKSLHEVAEWLVAKSRVKLVA